MVESVREDLGLLIHLQEIYDRIATAITERSTPPPEVQELQEENRRRLLELEELEGELETRKEELAQVKVKENEWKLELEHFQKQKGMVTNEREFTAVISEIDYASKALEESTARRAELETEIAQSGHDIEARREARPEEEAAHKNVVTSWEGRKSELKEMVHNLAEEASRLEQRLAPKHRAQFLRLLKSKRGTAVSAVVESSCSVCHFALRPHLQQRVTRAQEIITCEHCHRILYVADMREELVNMAQGA
jgi:predicted  nucleic acid-binding Zn-ribbon protein